MDNLKSVFIAFRRKMSLGAPVRLRRKVELLMRRTNSNLGRRKLTLKTRRTNKLSESGQKAIFEYFLQNEAKYTLS